MPGSPVNFADQIAKYRDATFSRGTDVYFHLKFLNAVTLAISDLRGCCIFPDEPGPKNAAAHNSPG
jgi:hypothetical protein